MSRHLYTFVRGGRVETGGSKHWVYTAGELRRMMERAGLRVSRMWGSLDLRAFELGSEQLLLVADRAAPPSPASATIGS